MGLEPLFILNGLNEQCSKLSNMLGTTENSSREDVHKMFQMVRLVNEQLIKPAH
jgi:hypothetical protein